MKDEGARFRSFSVPEDRCLRLHLKNVGKGMPETDIGGELEALHTICKPSFSTRPRMETKLTGCQRRISLLESG